MIAKAVAPAVLLLATALRASAACQPSDIELSQVSWRVDGSAVKYVGEIKNRCAEPAGVQVQVVFREKDGRLLGTNEFWPASTRNILSGDSYPFSGLTTDSAIRGAAAMSMRVIEVRRW